MAATVLSLSCRKALESNSNSTAGESNSNAAQSQPSASSQPTPTAVDKDKMLKQLITVEKEFMAAIKSGDKDTIKHLMADDFSARYGDKLYDKNSWIGDPKGFPNIATDEILNPELIGYTEDTATIHFDQRTTYNDNTPSSISTVSVSFVKKYGSWQIKSILVGH